MVFALLPVYSVLHMFCVVWYSLSVVLCGLCITMYCELCLLYYVFYAILYYIKNYLNPALLSVYYVAILCASRIMHFYTVLYEFSYTANIGGCVSKLCTVVVTSVLCLHYCQHSVLCV